MTASLNIYDRKLPKVLGKFEAANHSVYDLYEKAGPYQWSIILTKVDILHFYEQSLLKKGQKLKANKALSDLICKCKKFKEKRIPAFLFFYICAFSITPPWELREVALGGIKYKIAWYIYRQRRRLYSFTWFASCCNRRVKSKIDKIADLMIRFWDFEGKAWEKKKKQVDYGIDNRGFMHFLKD
jgi:ribosomal protein S7